VEVNSLSVIPLGGLEEIGLNMTVFQYADDLIIVDAGLMFPEEDMLGVDFVIPDFSYVLDNREKVKGIILTHGHEDHTGALPFLLKEINVPVFGTPLTLALVREKLKEHNITDVSLMPIRPRDTVNLGAFKIEFMRVTHSIVDGVGLGINTPLGNIIHTGDFKLDPTPVDGELMDRRRRINGFSQIFGIRGEGNITDAFRQHQCRKRRVYILRKRGEKGV